MDKNQRETLATALGLAAHVILFLAKYLNVPLRF